MKRFLLIGHILSALLQCLVFPLISQSLRRYLVQKWAIHLLKILRVKVVIHGNVEELFQKKPYLLVANHISWLDIHVLNSVRPVIFVAKSDVSSWPIFGYLAKILGTIFLNREKLSDIKRVLNEMTHKFQKSEVVAIFPEGTSTDGRQVQTFKSNLFEAAVRSQVDVLPVLIQYKEQNQYSDRAAFIGDMGLLDSIQKILLSNHLEAHLYLAGTITDQAPRQELAVKAQQAIVAKLENPQVR